MTPQEKAEELVVKFQQSRDAEDYNDVRDIHAAIRCALIVVDEILWEIIKYADNSREYVVKNSLYWQEVKQEIEKL
jgi:hypothetical protein